MPLVSGPISSAITKTIAAPQVEISMGTAKPSGWPWARYASTGAVKPAQIAPWW